MAIRIQHARATLGPDGVIDYRQVQRDEAILEFSVNYRILWRGHWFPVVRYDNCHGRPHMHRFWDDVAPVVELDDRPSDGLEEQLRVVRRDLQRHWQAYRRLMFGKLGQPLHGTDDDGGLA